MLPTGGCRVSTKGRVGISASGKIRKVQEGGNDSTKLINELQRLVIDQHGEC